MDKAEVVGKVKDLIGNQVGVEVRAIEDTDCLEADLGMDSLDCLNLATELGEQCLVVFEDDEIKGTHSVEEVADMVIAKQSEQD